MMLWVQPFTTADAEAAEECKNDSDTEYGTDHILIHNSRGGGDMIMPSHKLVTEICHCFGA